MPVNIRRSEIDRARSAIITATLDIEAHHAACVFAEMLAQILRWQGPITQPEIERLASDCECFARGFAKLAK